jgi:hypothetical protein
VLKVAGLLGGWVAGASGGVSTDTASYVTTQLPNYP